MKFFTKIIITIVIFTLCNTSFLYKSEITNTVESETQTEIINFKRFVTEAHGHLMPSSGSCTDPSKCRSLNEMLYIAYERSIALKKELSFDKMFIASVQNKLDINGVSKILMTLPELVKAVGHDRGAVMFRICVPTDRSKKSFMDIKCPMLDCPATLEEALICADDPSVASMSK